jgi:HEAT repeat protein
MRARANWGLFLCLLACGGCGKEKSTNELIGDLKSPQERDRVIAARTLPKHHGDAAQVVPALIEDLKTNKDGEGRRDAAIGLGSFGEQAKEAIPALQAALRDKDARARKAAATALSRIDPEKYPDPAKIKAPPGK